MSFTAAPFDAPHERAGPGLFRRRPFVRVVRDESGATAVEFSLLALPFTALVVFILEHGYNSFILSELDLATSRVARQIMIGEAQRNNVSINDIRAQICDQLRVGAGCVGRLFVSVRQLSGVSAATGAGLAEVNQATNTFCPGSGGAYTVISTVYATPTISPIWFSSNVTVNGQSVMALRSVRAIRNEPFSNSGAAC